MKEQLQHGRAYALLNKYIGKESHYAEFLFVAFTLFNGIHQYRYGIALKEWVLQISIVFILLFSTYVLIPHELTHFFPLRLFGGKVKIVSTKKVFGIPIYNLTIETTQHRYTKWQYAVSFILPTVASVVSYLFGLAYCIGLTNNYLFLVLLPICIKGCNSDISYFVEILQSGSKRFFMIVNPVVEHYGES